MLTAIILLSIFLAASLEFNWIQEHSRRSEIRSFQRERNSWQTERQQLIDKVMLQKGYREYAPPVPLPEPLSIEPEWTEESLEEGFQPL